MLLVCLPVPLAIGLAETQSSPSSQQLPDLSVFLDGIKRNLRSDRSLLNQYTYQMKETERQLDKNGHVKKTKVRVYEVYPSPDEDLTYRRLISENNTPLDPKKLEEQNHKYNEKAEKEARRLRRDGKSTPEQRLAKEIEENKKEQEIIEDLFNIYDFSLVHREVVDGHSAILVEFSPKALYEPETKEGRILKKIRGRALVSETEYQFIRLETELIEDIPIALGLLARVHKGSQFSFIRRKVNNEIWLPAEARFVGSARVVLFKMFRVETINVFSDYKKYSVSNSFEFLSQKPASREIK